MIELFDESLTRFEKSLKGEKADCDFDAYFMAIAFLDTIYIFTRMLLDSVVGIVNEYNKEGRLHDNFSKIYYEEFVKGNLTNELNTVFSACESWFPQFNIRRNDIVHRYETNFIVFRQNSEGERIAQQLSPQKNTQNIEDEDLRSYIGMVMAGYQCLVDKLLDYWDKMFLSWYGMSVSRHSTAFLGRSANILWWAYQYGGYRNYNMVVSES